jgi:hypothetical protein
LQFALAATVLTPAQDEDSFLIRHRCFSVEYVGQQLFPRPSEARNKPAKENRGRSRTGSLGNQESRSFDREDSGERIRGGAGQRDGGIRENVE